MRFVTPPSPPVSLAARFVNRSHSFKKEGGRPTAGRPSAGAMLVAGGVQGRFQRSRAVTLAPTMGVDSGQVRPSARTLHRGEWCEECNGLVVFGGETDQDMCDPQVCCLKVSVEGWKWEVVKTSGDNSMPVPGKPSARHPLAPWATRGDEGDPGCRIGHCFTRMRNFMVLSGGIRDRGAFQNGVYVLDLYSGQWSKPAIRLTPPSADALSASSRTLQGTTPEGLPTARTGHSATGFQHGVVMFGGFDGSYLGDVHYLYFHSGVGLVIKEKEDDKNSSVRRLNRYVVAEILSGTHAEDNKCIKVGDYVMAVGDLQIDEGVDLSEIRHKMWGPIGTAISLRFLRYRGRAQAPEELGNHALTRGEQLHHVDGVWTWIRPGISVEELTDLHWHSQSGVSGTVTCQPTPRFYHSAASIDNNVLIFGGFDGYNYQNDLYLLETYAEGDFHREWKWRTPTTSGPAPSRRSYAGIGVVGRKAVITGGSEGREKFGDIFVLDCDEWTWSKLPLPTMIPIAQHCVATYASPPTAEQYDNLANAELNAMSMEQLYDLITSKGEAASVHEPKNKQEVLNLVRCLLLRPGLLLHSGLQSPLEPGEVKGRRIDTWVLELPYSAASSFGQPRGIDSPTARSPGVGSPIGLGSPMGRAKASAKSARSPARTAAHSGMVTDVFVVGSNVQGYLGLGLDNQPSHPEDSGLGAARYAHDANPPTCIRLEQLSTMCFEYFPNAKGLELAAEECVLQIACGAEHVVALCKDGRLFTWGQNENGQLGLGDNRQRQSPYHVYTFPAGSHVLKDVACGQAHTMAVSTRDELFTWGRNGHGQLGLGHGHDRNSPQRVESLSCRVVLHMAGGACHSLVYVKSGGLYSFGCNDSGQLGSGNQIGNKSPANVALLKEVEIVSISAGIMHSAAVSSTGACYTWGGGIRGQLGHGRFEEHWLAKEVVLSGLGDKEALQVSCGDYFTGLLVKEACTNAVEAWLFGSNKHGELGFGAGGQDCATPVGVQHFVGKELLEIVLGSNHCLATCKDGMVYGWGCNRSGQLGLGHSRDMWAPQQILIEQGGRTESDNYPWLAVPSAKTLSYAKRFGNQRVSTKALAANNASFFVCGITPEARLGELSLQSLRKATATASSGSPNSSSQTSPAPHASAPRSPGSRFQRHQRYLGEGGEGWPHLQPGIPFKPDKESLDAPPVADDVFNRPSM